MAQRVMIPNHNALALAILRIAVGVLFLIFGEYKVFGTQFTVHGGLRHWINQFIAEGAYPFMVPILRRVVLHFATPIVFLVAYGELAIGVALVSGVLVRPASACGLLYMLTQQGAASPVLLRRGKADPNSWK
jgi:thiosulfate dehydrogenase (quinone) large subunit